MKTLPSRISPRRSDYDYTSSGAYFVTICTAGRQYYFWEVVEGEMRLNPLGIYTTQHWNQISDHYPFVETREFVCMPNHIHGIIMIGERTWNRDVGTQFFASDMRIQDTSDTDKHNAPDTGNTFASNIDKIPAYNIDNHNSSINDNTFASGWQNDIQGMHWSENQRTYMDNIQRTYKNTSLPKPPPSWSLGAIIRGYKIWITKYAKQLNTEFKRQWRYHDHVIRNEKEYNAIKHYIHTNPQKRWEDTFYDW